MDGRAVEWDVGSEEGRRKQRPDARPRVERSPVQQAPVDWVLPEPGQVKVALIAPQEIRQSLGEFLHAAGMSVQIWNTPAAFDGAAAGLAVDAVVIDAGTFGADAYSLMARLRSTLTVGVVMLVAEGRRTDRMLALSLGADHCMPSPPDPQELELCLRNLYRRVRQPATAGAHALRSPGTAGTLRTWLFDTTEWTLTAPNGRSTPMSMTDHRVLHRLLQEPGAVVSRAELLGELERNRIKLGSRNLDMVVSRLRKKVAKECGERLPVRSVRGIGYVFAAQCETVYGPHPTPDPRLPQ